jgi:hypothetical protein
MKMKIGAVLVSSLLAASSFAQASSLSAPTAQSADEALVESVSSDLEVAILPLLAGAALGALLVEAAHHHFAQQQESTSASLSPEAAEALFDR